MMPSSADALAGLVQRTLGHVVIGWAGAKDDPPYVIGQKFFSFAGASMAIGLLEITAETDRADWDRQYEWIFGEPDSRKKAQQWKFYRCSYGKR